MSWFASHEQAPLQDPPTEPRAIRSHAAPAEGPAEAHQCAIRRRISGAHAARQAAADTLGRGPLRTARSTWPSGRGAGAPRGPRGRAAPARGADAAAGLSRSTARAASRAGGAWPCSCAARIRRQPQQALQHAGPTPTQTRGARKGAARSAPRRWPARARLELQQEAGGCALAAVPRRMSRRRPRELRVWRPLDLREEESGGSG